MSNSLNGQNGWRGPKGVPSNMNPLLAKILIKYYYYTWKLVCFLSKFIPYFERWK